MITETICEDPRWSQYDLPLLAEQGVMAVLTHLRVDPSKCEVAVLGCDDARIAALNGTFRDKDIATNVLSWPDQELAALDDGGTPEPPDLADDPTLGDIAIAFETCLSEAEAQGKPVRDHVIHLIVHATLHLLGYDHVRDKDATLMEGIEVAILGKLGLPDPYR